MGVGEGEQRGGPGHVEGEATMYHRDIWDHL